MSSYDPRYIQALRARGMPMPGMFPMGGLSRMRAPQQMPMGIPTGTPGFTGWRSPFDLNAKLTPELTRAVYQNALGRDPEAGTHEKWAAVGGNVQNLFDAITASQEFNQRAAAVNRAQRAPQGGLGTFYPRGMQLGQRPANMALGYNMLFGNTPQAVRSRWQGWGRGLPSFYTPPPRPVAANPMAPTPFMGPDYGGGGNASDGAPGGDSTGGHASDSYGGGTGDPSGSGSPWKRGGLAYYADGGGPAAPRGGRNDSPDPYIAEMMRRGKLDPRMLGPDVLEMLRLRYSQPGTAFTGQQVRDETAQVNRNPDSRPRFATGGLGRLVEGPGDGRSDDIPARLSNGEYVIPADVVAAKGNGSTEAGARELHKMVVGTRQKYAKKLRNLPPPKR